MELIRKNELNETDYKEITYLTDKCRHSDNLTPLTFTENDINVLTEYKCFNMLYENSYLICFLSVFIPGDGSAEIYACTHPEYRCKGIFSELLSVVQTELISNGIARIFLVCNPGSKSADSFISNKNLHIEYSEFLLTLSEDYKSTISEYIFSHKEMLQSSDLKVFQIDSATDCIDLSDILTLQFEVYINNDLIGGCLVEMENECATIYDYYIELKHRGKGFGTSVLMLILDYLTNDFAESVILQLHGDNIKAKSLYLNHGFEITSQINYISL